MVYIRFSQENGSNHGVGRVVGMSVLQGTGPLSSQPCPRFPIIALRNTRVAESQILLHDSPGNWQFTEAANAKVHTKLRDRPHISSGRCMAYARC